MKKILLPVLLPLVFSAPFRQAQSQSLSTGPTLTFSNATGFGDNIAQDGEGGSVAITDINIQVLPINNLGTKLTADPLEYHGADWGTPSMITYCGINALYGWSILSDNGAEFSLAAFDLFDWGDWSGGNYTVQAFRNGVSLGSVAVAGSTNNTMVHLTNAGVLTSIFKNVDEVRVHKQSGADSWPALNNIKVSAPILPLPLTWLRFSAEVGDEGVLLAWSTAAEQHTADFTVAHSADGNSWTGIATIGAAGESTTVKEYRYLHRAAGSGVHFYRIAEQDLDGQTSYSKVLTVQGSRSAALPGVYPNPVTDGRITVAADGAETIRVMNSAGSLVFEQQLRDGVQQVLLPCLQSGWYLVRIGSKTERLLVQ